MAPELKSSSEPNYLNHLHIGLPDAPDVNFYYVDPVDSIDECVTLLSKNYSDISEIKPNNSSSVYQRIAGFLSSDPFDDKPKNPANGAVVIYPQSEKIDIYLLLQKKDEKVSVVSALRQEFYVALLYGLEREIEEKIELESGAMIDFSKVADVETQSYIPVIHYLMQKKIPLVTNGNYHIREAEQIYLAAYLQANPKLLS
jgi:hypothetical protein